MGAAAVIEAAYLRRSLGSVVGIVTFAGQTAETHNLKNLEKVPFLAVHGSQDQVLPVSSSQILVKLAQQGSLHVLHTATHRMEGAMAPVVEFVEAHLPRIAK